MLKKIFFLFCLITSTPHMHAMELPSCCFSNMPSEIIDLIASFLTFDDIESEQEFIERTKVIITKTIPTHWWKRFPESYKTSEKTLTASCPNDTICALLYQPDAYNCRGESALIIIDLKKDIQVYGEILCGHPNYYKIAVSRNGNMFATLHVAHDSRGGRVEKLHSQNVLTIKNHITKHIQQSLDVPSCFRDNSQLAFNKEGTHIIANYMLIPLTINVPDINSDKKKTLQKYFEQRMICKNFTQQLILTK